MKTAETGKARRGWRAGSFASILSVFLVGRGVIRENAMIAGYGRYLYLMERK